MAVNLKSLVPEVGLPSGRTILLALLAPTVVSLVGVLAGQVHYLLFHTLAELFSILIAVSAMMVSSTSRSFTRNHFTVFVATAIGWCALLDVLHVLTYKGMYLLPYDEDMATQFWIAARSIQAASMLVAPLFLRRSVHLGYIHAIFALLVLLTGVSIFSDSFPVAFVEGKGLTPFKIYAEYVIIATLGLSAALLWRYRLLMSSSTLVTLLAAVGAMILSEFSFTRYSNVYGFANEVGHVLKIFAYWFVYLALVERTLVEPFSMLTRASSTFDAVPDPSFVTGMDGRIRQANLAASRYAGQDVEKLLDQPIHGWFHAVDVAPQDCPVCARVARGESNFTVTIERGKGLGTVECSVAPFDIPGSRRRNFIQIVHDITERQHLLSEREILVHDLGERIKELRCQSAITDVLQDREADIPRMLNGVVAALPPGFLFPEQARAAFAGLLGTYGAEGAAQARHVMRRPVLVNGESVGTLTVFYPADPGRTGDPFLPEEQTLLSIVAQHLGDAIERLQAGQQVKRLTYIYEMLSAINRTIVRCRSNEELLSAMFEALMRHGAFPKLFIARATDGGMPLQVVHSHGIDIGKQEMLGKILAEAQSPIGVLLDQVRHGEVVWSVLRGTDDYKPWVDYLEGEGITERAIVPLIRDRQLFGIIGLYAMGNGRFDANQINLLKEMADDLEFALNGIATRERSVAAQQRADISDARFRELFQVSPTPTQISSLSQRTFSAINRAHQAWLGYALEEIPDEDAWFARVYPDPESRQQMQAQWSRDLASARVTGGSFSSPEIRLRAKDGRDRVAVGSMTVLGDDVIVTWNDLTAVHANEQALRQSEQHFRTMIEQTVSGVYVRRGERFVYVNPRYCEMTGWTREELVDQPIWNFTSQLPDNVRHIHEAWHRLEHGERNVSYEVPLMTKSGQVLELSLRANPIDWDGHPATIVMAEDITERRRAEQQIAGYVKQLEASMRGSLQAVANMIDLRDPYTAGHERRVGLVAGAIARELGWSEERATQLELIGLVHDIGKVAVPAEILSKPGRLSPVEMQLVRGHAQAGYDILKDIPFSFPVAEIIYQHHERLDGSGYPRGLKGEEILPEARILCVADVLESISAHRPYRPALGIDAALNELEKGYGVLYDVEVIDAVRRLVHEKGYVIPQ